MYFVRESSIFFKGWSQKRNVSGKLFASSQGFSYFLGISPLSGQPLIEWSKGYFLPFLALESLCPSTMFPCPHFRF